jgi:hypothetical protein
MQAFVVALPIRRWLKATRPRKLCRCPHLRRVARLRLQGRERNRVIVWNLAIAQIARTRKRTRKRERELAAALACARAWAGRKCVMWTRSLRGNGLFVTIPPLACCPASALSSDPFRAAGRLPGPKIRCTAYRLWAACRRRLRTPRVRHEPRYKPLAPALTVRMTLLQSARARAATRSNWLFRPRFERLRRGHALCARRPEGHRRAFRVPGATRRCGRPPKWAGDI